MFDNLEDMSVVFENRAMFQSSVDLHSCGYGGTGNRKGEVLLYPVPLAVTGHFGPPAERKMLRKMHEKVGCTSAPPLENILFCKTSGFISKSKFTQLALPSSTVFPSPASRKGLKHPGHFEQEAHPCSTCLSSVT